MGSPVFLKNLPMPTQSPATCLSVRLIELFLGPCLTVFPAQDADSFFASAPVLLDLFLLSCLVHSVSLVIWAGTALVALLHSFG